MSRNKEKTVLAEDHERTLVLFVAAEPRGSDPIRLGTEFRDIIDEVERKGRDGGIEFRTLWAARPVDVTRAMSDYEPVIVHFSGHGTPNGGFLLESVDGSAKEIDRRAMGSIFDTYKKRVKAVVLNSCYSDELAEEIAKSVDVVIGMQEEIGIEAAVRFSVGFYRGVAARECFQQCFQMAKTEIAMEMIPESHLPILHTRPGVEAYKVFALDAPNLDRWHRRSSSDAHGRSVDARAAIHAERVATVLLGDNVRTGPGPAELALGGLGGAAAMRCLDIMIQNHQGSDQQGESSLEDEGARADTGLQRDDSGKLVALQGISVRQYAEAEPWQLATELGNGHTVLVGTESHTDWRPNQIFLDLGATDPILLSRIETSDPALTRVVVISPGSGKGSAAYPIGEFLDAWRGTRFFMVATQEPSPFEVRFSGANGFRPEAGSIGDAIWDGLQEVASEAPDESVVSHLDSHVPNEADVQGLLDPACHEHHGQPPSPLVGGFGETSTTTCHFADPLGPDEDNELLDAPLGDLGEDEWSGVE